MSSGTGTGSYRLHLDLGPLPAGVDDVRTEIGDRLDAFAPRLTAVAGRVEVRLTVEAADVWLAVLLAMAAVTGTGYTVHGLDARVAGRVDRVPDSCP